MKQRGGKLKTQSDSSCRFLGRKKLVLNEALGTAFQVFFSFLGTRCKNTVTAQTLSAPPVKRIDEKWIRASL